MSSAPQFDSSLPAGFFFFLRRRDLLNRHLHSKLRDSSKANNSFTPANVFFFFCLFSRGKNTERLQSQTSPTLRSVKEQTMTAGPSAQQAEHFCLSSFDSFQSVPVSLSFFVAICQHSAHFGSISLIISSVSYFLLNTIFPNVLLYYFTALLCSKDCIWQLVNVHDERSMKLYLYLSNVM